MTPLKTLASKGQAVWLDFLARRFLAEGGLSKLISEDGLTGVTSNPSIFEKAIADSTDYDDALKAALANEDQDVKSLYEGLAIEDIQSAAENLKPVFEASQGKDGYVSLEVSPYLANDQARTIAEARRLWKQVGRPNVMIKVPGTDAGIEAIRELIFDGININVTLLFSQEMYERVAIAYIEGLEKRVAEGRDISKVASVASFFVSRIDVAVEKQIKEQLAIPSANTELLKSLNGKVAIANAKLAYQSYKRLFQDARFTKLASQGAHVQRVLWASTGTKNKEYSDVLYVDELIAADTVNTMPPETMNAFRDHGHVTDSLEAKIEEAKKVMADLKKVGISIDDLTKKLVTEGIQLFADAFDKLLGAIARKRVLFQKGAIDTFSYDIDNETNEAVKASLEVWRKEGRVRKLWNRDARLWSNKDEAKWLEWLSIVEKELGDIARLDSFAAAVMKGNFSHILLLGMGGSSLGPEVFAETFGKQKNAPELLVLDSTDPQQVRRFESRIDLARTLFIVSSKSGTTLEPNVLKQYFFDRAKVVLGAEKAGDHFVAVTDPGSKMEKIAKDDKFRFIGLGSPEIGGRYSVLSDFGLVPAAAMGLDLKSFLKTTMQMVRGCSESVPPADNPGIVLGTILGVLNKTGRDKVTIVSSPGIGDFGAWLEQLLAESTGKQGKAVIPVDGEALGAPSVYGKDRVFAYMRLTSSPDKKQDEAIAALKSAGQPVLTIDVLDPMHIGQEFFRWELATAVAGSLLSINPFDQPDVEASKIKTRELTSAYEKNGSLPALMPTFEGEGIKLFADPDNEAELRKGGAPSTLKEWLKAHFARIKPGDYCGFLAYVDRTPKARELVADMRIAIRDSKHVATVVGFGPRFLHSTGQAYKGGPNSGVFIQITCNDKADLDVPGQKYSFGIVKAAEAQGDLEVLNERGRRLIRLHIGSDIDQGLATLNKAIRESLS